MIYFVFHCIQTFLYCVYVYIYMYRFTSSIPLIILFLGERSFFWMGFMVENFLSNGDFFSRTWSVGPCTADLPFLLAVLPRWSCGWCGLYCHSCYLSFGDLAVLLSQDLWKKKSRRIGIAMCNKSSVFSDSFHCFTNVCNVGTASYACWFTLVYKPRQHPLTK